MSQPTLYGFVCYSVLAQMKLNSTSSREERSRKSNPFVVKLIWFCEKPVVPDEILHFAMHTKWGCKMDCLNQSAKLYFILQMFYQTMRCFSWSKDRSVCMCEKKKCVKLHSWEMSDLSQTKCSKSSSNYNNSKVNWIGVGFCTAMSFNETVDSSNSVGTDSSSNRHAN